MDTNEVINLKWNCHDFIVEFDYREENNLPNVEPFTLEVVE